MFDTRSFIPVTLKNGSCPDPAWHFKGCAREVFKYLRFLANLSDGFIFCGIKTIVRNTKNWKKNRRPYEERQVRRVLKAFIALGVLLVVVQKANGRTRTGWRLADHDAWTEPCGHICEFIAWDLWESHHAKCVGNQSFAQQNVRSNVRCNVRSNVRCDVKSRADIIEANSQQVQ